MKLYFIIFSGLICGLLHAQSVRYVTLFSEGDFQSCPICTNDLVELLSGGSDGFEIINGTCASGNINLIPIRLCSGLTNISLISLAGSNGRAVFESATFSITTPKSANVISNYVPADAIVIPASATGNVQIILESSPDLVNWTAASPGTYGASAGTNRFFRVRAAAN